jgi:hypothetical protein
MDDHPDSWLTLTEAAERTGHTREAIRARIRRGSLPATKGNDGQLRVQARDLADLAPPDEATDAAMDGHGPEEDAAVDATAAVLLSTVAGLRTAVDELRTTLAATVDKALADRVADHGRAERAEAQVVAERERTTLAETRLATTEAALAEARTPWAVRVIRAWRRSER